MSSQVVTLPLSVWFGAASACNFAGVHSVAVSSTTVDRRVRTRLLLRLPRATGEKSDDAASRDTAHSTLGVRDGRCRRWVCHRLGDGRPGRGRMARLPLLQLPGLSPRGDGQYRDERATEAVGNNTPAIVHWCDDEPVDNGHLYRQFAALGDIAGDMIERGVTPSARQSLRAALSERFLFGRLHALYGGRQNVLAEARSP